MVSVLTIIHPRIWVSFVENTNTPEDLIYRLRKRAEIRRQIQTRKSVQENAPDRIADLLEEAADEIERLQGVCDGY